MTRKLGMNFVISCFVAILCGSGEHGNAGNSCRGTYWHNSRWWHPPCWSSAITASCSPLSSLGSSTSSSAGISRASGDIGRCRDGCHGSWSWVHLLMETLSAGINFRFLIWWLVLLLSSNAMDTCLVTGFIFRTVPSVALYLVPLLAICTLSPCFNFACGSSVSGRFTGWFSNRLMNTSISVFRWFNF